MSSPATIQHNLNSSHCLCQECLSFKAQRILKVAKEAHERKLRLKGAAAATGDSKKSTTNLAPHQKNEKSDSSNENAASTNSDMPRTSSRVFFPSSNSITSTSVQSRSKRRKSILASSNMSSFSEEDITLASAGGRNSETSFRPIYSVPKRNISWPLKNEVSSNYSSSPSSLDVCDSTLTINSNDVDVGSQSLSNTTLTPSSPLSAPAAVSTVQPTLKTNLPNLKATVNTTTTTTTTSSSKIVPQVMRNGDRIKIVRQGDKVELERSKSLLSDSMQKELLAAGHFNTITSSDYHTTDRVTYKLALMNPDKNEDGSDEEEDDIVKSKRVIREQKLLQ